MYVLSSSPFSGHGSVRIYSPTCIHTISYIQQSPFVRSSSKFRWFRFGVFDLQIFDLGIRLRRVIAKKSPGILQTSSIHHENTSVWELTERGGSEVFIITPDLVS